jgi:hypothetical protein
MATRHKFARMANYSCECVEASHIFSRNGLWRMWASLAIPSKTGWRMWANLASPTNFPKRPFWRVLEFDKFEVEWPLLSQMQIKSNLMVIFNLVTILGIVPFLQAWPDQRYLLISSIGGNWLNVKHNRLLKL